MYLVYTLFPKGSRFLWSTCKELNRLHQFDKVEIVRIEHPEKSYEALEGMVEHIKKYFARIEIAVSYFTPL